MKRHALIHLALAFCVVTFASQALAAAPATTAAPEASLVGSWVTTVTPDPASGNPPFRELFTFHSDGTLTMIDDNAPGPPFPFTPGHGVWKRTATGFIFHYLNLIYDPATFASNGQTNITVRVDLDEKGDSLSGSGHLKVSDKDGNLLFEADGTIVGDRITIDQP